MSTRWKSTPASTEHRLSADILTTTRRNIAQTDTIQTLESWGSPITVTEVTSGESVQVWRRGTAASASLFTLADEDTNYHAATSP